MSGNMKTRKSNEKRASKRAQQTRSAAATALEVSPPLSPPSQTTAMGAASVPETSRMEPLNPMGDPGVTPRDSSSEPASTAVPHVLAVGGSQDPLDHAAIGNRLVRDDVALASDSEAVDNQIRDVGHDSENEGSEASGMPSGVVSPIRFLRELGTSEHCSEGSDSASDRNSQSSDTHIGCSDANLAIFHSKSLEMSLWVVETQISYKCILGCSLVPLGVGGLLPGR
jgi:hypothetical protein